ncbi:GrpB family protein [Couchioplanes caeruleus]|uniref:GrpB family protein n=1 Tax=Couchioplanes caeruleus TaxID=56438 RepID=UPI0020C16AD9|nr:GrpB family protein [Couchioplanes caeruleus]UQU63716.1 GrpB family protein [Couchioplanes caeruleus]
MTIAEPDDRWSELGRQACVTLAPLFTAVEHVGSTAVPGLAAKPVIDLMAALDELAEVNDPALQSLGYRLQPTDMPERLFYRREDYDSTAYHLHVVTAESWPTRNERLLRDHLLAYPEARDRYGALKRELMDRYGPGDAYTRGKTRLIQELTDAARAERGLPPVPVWEE